MASTTSSSSYCHFSYLALSFLAGGALAALATTARFRAERKLYLKDDSNSLTLQEEDEEKDKCIYLDYSATTPIDVRVHDAMKPYFTRHFGNPSSGHFYGQEPKRAVDRARRQILQLLMGRNTGTTTINDNVDVTSIWFTSCGTEADNLAIRLALMHAQEVSDKVAPPCIVTCNVEHPAISKYLDQMEKTGQCKVVAVPVQADGRIEAKDVITAIEDNKNTVLVSIMLANNESGAVQPIRPIAEYCRQHGVLIHTDAAQAAGKISVNLQEMGDPDMVTLVGHKIGAPKGVGCLYVRPGCSVSSMKTFPAGGILMVGGGQEFGRRGGTENVPYIVGLGKAAELADQHWKENAMKMESLRTRMIALLETKFGADRIRVNGPADVQNRLPNTLSVGLKGVHSGKLLASIGDKVAASAGAACHSGATDEISGVLRAMQVPLEFARGTLRLSVGPNTTKAEVDKAIDIIVAEAVTQLKVDAV